MGARGLKRHVVLLVLAIGLLAVAFAVAIVMNAFGLRPPGVDFPLLVVGTVAVSFSLPLVALPILVATRRNVRESWRVSDVPARRVLIVYLAIEAAAALAAWTVFILLVTYR